MFIAPYGCSWANPSPCKSLLAQCFKYRAWFKHTFLFGSLAFSYSLERVNFSFVHTNLSRYCSLQYCFHPEMGKPVSSFWIRYTSPRPVVRKRFCSTFQSTNPTHYLCFSLPVITYTPLVTQWPFSPGACEKTSVNFGSISTSPWHPIYNWTIYVTGPYANLLCSRTPRNSQSSFTLNGLAVLITMEFRWKC